MSEGSSQITALSGRRRLRDADAEPPERGARAARHEAPHLREVPPGHGEAHARLRALLASARGKERALVLTHDNPDPDSLASAMGLAWLLEEHGGVPAKVAYGGIVGRAENRALVRVLKLPVLPLAKVELEEYDFLCIVDTQPSCGNHSLPPQRHFDVVIDHHPARPTSCKAAFHEVGGDYGATASIITSYVRAAGDRPPPVLATALFYGIKSDTRDLGREFSDVDVDNYHWLFPMVDHEALSRIEHPAVPASYFAALHQALGRARRHGETVIADLGPIETPDIVAEVAERLLALEETRWSLAVGRFKGALYLSVRTNDRRMNAGRLVQDVLVPLGGSAGGHGTMAGGRVPIPRTTRERNALQKKLVGAFLEEVGAPSKGEPLV